MENMTIKDFVKQSKYNSAIRNLINAWNSAGYDIQAWIINNSPIVEVQKSDIIEKISTGNYDCNHVYLILDECGHFILLKWKSDEDNDYDEDEDSEFIEYYPLMQNSIGQFAQTPDDCIAWLNKLSVQSLLQFDVPFTKKQQKPYHLYHIEYRYNELKKHRIENATVLKFDKILQTHLSKYVHSYTRLGTPNFQEEFLSNIRLYIEDLFKAFAPHIDPTIAEIKFTEFDVANDILYIELRGDFSKCTGKRSDKYVSVIPLTTRNVSRIAGRLVGTGWNIVQFYMTFYQILGHFIPNAKYNALNNYYSNLKCARVYSNSSGAVYYMNSVGFLSSKKYQIKFNEELPVAGTSHQI